MHGAATPGMLASLILVLVISASGLAGCLAGFETDLNGRYYRCESKAGLDVAEIRHVGIYVFSNGRFSSANKLRPELFPEKVTRESVFYPDTANSIPSHALADAIRDELDKRGYTATVANDLGHSHMVDLDNCLKNAAANGYDAIFVAYYTGICPWSKSWLESHTMTVSSSAYMDERLQALALAAGGYLYLPNTALLDAHTGEVLWSNSYYGLVQHAHVMNLSNEGFNTVVPEAVEGTSAPSCLEAARKVTSIIFDPPMWRAAFREFPSKGERKKRL